MNQTNNKNLIKHGPSQFLPLIILTSFFLPILAVTNPSSSGFSLRLIHRDPPLHLENLTDVERIQSLISYSKARILDLAGIRSPMRLASFLYTVQVGIGTPPATHHLILDTGSSVTWIQCVGCNPSIPQNHPLFDPSRSDSAAIVTCHKPIRPTSNIFSCINNKWYYNIQYSSAPNSRSTQSPVVKGFLYKETFTFMSGNGGDEVVPHLTFGCNTESHNVINHHDELDGIMGLGRDRTSFSTQLSSTVESRFSYCLTRSRTSFLRFGAEVTITESNVVTVKFETPQHERNLYFLKMVDISVNNRRLNVKSGGFKFGWDATKSLAIDSGCALTNLHKSVYKKVAAAVNNYMERHGAGMFMSRNVDLEHCWKVHDDYPSLPTMTFHFKGGDLEVDGKNLFVAIPDQDRVFCLALLPNDRFSVLGVMQQHDYRFVFDNYRQQLQFAAADC